MQCLVLILAPGGGANIIVQRPLSKGLLAVVFIPPSWLHRLHSFFVILLSSLRRRLKGVVMSSYSWPTLASECPINVCRTLRIVHALILQATQVSQWPLQIRNKRVFSNKMCGWITWMLIALLSTVIVRSVLLEFSFPVLAVRIRRPMLFVHRDV